MAGEWIFRTLGEVIELKRGYDLPQQDRHTGEVPIVSSSGVSDHHSESKVRGPGVVTGRYGTLGEVFYIKEDFWPLNTTLYVQDFKGNDPRFISYFLRSLDFLAYSDKAAVPGLNRNHLHQAQVNIPIDVSEQRAIAHILGTLDDRIELNRRMSETLEEMARALFKSWFVDFDPVRAKSEGRDTGLPERLAALFPNRFVDSELGKIPEGWEVKALKSCCSQIRNGGTPKRSESRYWINGRIPWLTSGEVRQPIITFTESFITEAGLNESSAKWVDPFSTVVALYGATAGQVSFIASKLTTNQAVCALIPNEQYAFFNYLCLRNSIRDLEIKAVGSAQQNISKAIVEETISIIPTLTLLRAFNSFAEPLIMKWISNLHESRTLTALRDALLPKLISGELRVKDAEKFI
jgi:type I restriction enzyme S subunit